MPGRKSLPHAPPLSVDTTREIWFVTVCCKRRKENQLALPDVGKALLESVSYRRELGHWHPFLFLLMPDHCHALVSFPQERSIVRTVADWKHWTATRHGVEWQIDFFDHRLRDEESFSEKAAYIAQNPVRAGLVSDATAWPYVWRAPGVYVGG
jgi:REP element-mobilizing transposase RayT